MEHDGAAARDQTVVEVVPYDAGWPAAYARVAAELRGALGAVALGVLHIGSTAVPGLALHRWVTKVVEAALVDER